MTNLGNARRIEDRFRRMQRDRRIRDNRVKIAIGCLVLAGLGAIAWWMG